MPGRPAPGPAGPSRCRCAAHRPAAGSPATVSTTSSRSTGSRRTAAAAPASPRARRRRSSTSRCTPMVSASTLAAVAAGVGGLRVGGVDLELRAHPRQRTAQLVRGVGDEAALLFGGPFEAAEHRVHRAREPGDLASACPARAPADGGWTPRSSPPGPGCPRPGAAPDRPPTRRRRPGTAAGQRHGDDAVSRPAPPCCRPGRRGCPRPARWSPRRPARAAGPSRRRAVPR